METRIGTSGWHYNHWRGSFYPEKMQPARMLDWYARRFDTVELNNSFYKLPSLASVREWRDSVAPGFVFAVKASRFLTHNKKLKDPEQPLERLLPVAEAFGPKLGPILFQLPPRWRVNLDRLEALLRLLPPVHRYAFEFREPSWLCDPVCRLLERHNAALCLFQIAGMETPVHLTADFAYVRLHGPTLYKYCGSYSDEALAAWARRLEGWAAKLKAAYVYFDNDEAGHAAHDALRLKALLHMDARSAA